MLDTHLRIRELEASKNLIRAIHYGCESWHSVKDRPVAVVCIAIIDFKTHEEVSFSLTDFAEDAEKNLLQKYYKYLRESDARYVHWNMNFSDYGFEAIDNRYRYIFNADAPYIIPKDKRFDLDHLISTTYGKMYVNHPKFYNLVSINGLYKRYLLSGKEESNKFEKEEFGDIKRSTTEKARLIALLTKKFLDGTLETLHSGPKVIFGEEKLDSVKVVLELARRMKLIARQLARRYSNRQTIQINDEYDTQDLFHSLLRIFFDDIRQEEWTPNYAGGNKRMDFLIPAHSMAVELKHSRSSMTAKELGDQLVIDIQNYKQHHGVKLLVCIVFDTHGFIINPRGIETDLTGVQDGIRIETKIVD